MNLRELTQIRTRIAQAEQGGDVVPLADTLVLLAWLDQAIGLLEKFAPMAKEAGEELVKVQLQMAELRQNQAKLVGELEALRKHRGHLSDGGRS